MRLRLLAAVAVMLVLTISARADGFSLFDASGTFASGAILTGYVTLDETSGIVTAANLTVSAPDNLKFNAVTQATNYPDPGQTELQFGNGSAYALPILDLVIGSGSLVGYQGGFLGSQTHLVGRFGSDIAFSVGSYDSLHEGSLTAVTPEPSSLALLGTGILGIIGAARRRFAA